MLTLGYSACRYSTTGSPGGATMSSRSFAQDPRDEGALLVTTHVLCYFLSVDGVSVVLVVQILFNLLILLLHLTCHWQCQTSRCLVNCME